jgi:hypothetical protein
MLLTKTNVSYTHFAIFMIQPPLPGLLFSAILRQRYLVCSFAYPILLFSSITFAYLRSTSVQGPSCLLVNYTISNAIGARLRDYTNFLPKWLPWGSMFTTSRPVFFYGANGAHWFYDLLELLLVLMSLY